MLYAETATKARPQPQFSRNIEDSAACSDGCSDTTAHRNGGLQHNPAARPQAVEFHLTSVNKQKLIQIKGHQAERA